MADEVWAFCLDKGWEPDDDRTFGEEIALIHSEISEALEEYRDHELMPYVIDPDPTQSVTENIRYVMGQTYGDLKPLGVPSELADVLVRWLHYAKKRGLYFSDLNYYFTDIILETPYTTFGGWVAHLHNYTSRCYDEYAGRGIINGRAYTKILVALYQMAERFDINLEAEFKAKMEYNRTRSYRHGGKVL